MVAPCAAASPVSMMPPGHQWRATATPAPASTMPATTATTLRLSRSPASIPGDRTPESRCSPVAQRPTAWPAERWKGMEMRSHLVRRSVARRARTGPETFYNRVYDDGSVLVVTPTGDLDM